jgi:predicted Zn-dependent peptidase
MFTKAPKKFQLDLSGNNRQKINNEPTEDPSSSVDLIVGNSERAPQDNSFRARLAKKIAEDDGAANQRYERYGERREEKMEDDRAQRQDRQEKIAHKSVIPKLFQKAGNSRKLDLRAGDAVPPPVEISDQDEQEDEVENLDPHILKLKSLRSGSAEEMLKSERYEEREELPVKPKKKRRRRKKPAVILAPQTPVVIPPVAVAPVLAMPTNLPVAAEPLVAPAVLAVPEKKKRRKKRKPKTPAPTQEVAIKIIEAPKKVETEESDVDDVVDNRLRKSFRESLEAPDADSVEQVVKPVSYTFRERTLDNGLKVVFAPLAGTKTITALVMFGTGSKYESRSQNGLSHFLEHMFFKGTKNRGSAQKLSCELDSLGSEYNAFTSKEYTGYWIKVDSTKSEPALDILSDMLLNSKFSQAEIDRERGVIVEEINMYHENPMMYIEDVFEKCLYGETPAGREIIGPKENITSFKRQDFLDYFSTQYGSNSAVLVLSGAVTRQIEEMVTKYFDPMVKRPFKEKLKTPDHQDSAQVKTFYQNGKQANISLGVRTYDTYHEDKIILKVLSVILGGSMSSRMFTEVREKRGLAYYVRTQTEFFTDTGYLTTQAGVPVAKAEEAIETILAEYQKLTEKLVDKEELQRARDLIHGRTVIAFEESDAVANWYARQAVLREDMVNPEQFFAAIDKVTAEDIQRVATNIFKSNKLNLAVIGPYKGSIQFEKLLKFKKTSIVPGIFSFFA